MPLFQRPTPLRMRPPMRRWVGTVAAVVAAQSLPTRRHRHAYTTKVAWSFTVRPRWIGTVAAGPPAFDAALYTLNLTGVGQ